MDYLHHASFGIGVLVMVYGVASGLVSFLASEFKAICGGDVEEHRKRLRHVLGYYLLLGLEFLIAADIIDTLMKPSVQDLVVLGAIVLIRTVISYSLNSELRLEKNALAASPRRGLAGGGRQATFELPEGMGSTLLPFDEERTAQRGVPTSSTL